ncbi:unnamed protein product [Urochloa humidicola]
MSSHHIACPPYDQRDRCLPILLRLQPPALSALPSIVVAMSGCKAATTVPCLRLCGGLQVELQGRVGHKSLIHLQPNCRAPVRLWAHPVWVIVRIGSGDNS